MFQIPWDSGRFSLVSKMSKSYILHSGIFQAIPGNLDHLTAVTELGIWNTASSLQHPQAALVKKEP